MDGKNKMRPLSIFGFMILAAIIGVLFLTWPRGFSRNDLVGTYAFSNDGTIELLNVVRGGTYINILVRSDRVVWKRSGKWSLNKFNNDQGVTFDNFVFGVDGYPSVAGYWFVVPKAIIGGRMRLCFDPDLSDHCFLKARAR